MEEEEETMMKHLQRAGEVIALYRRCLEVARLFPDPCGRNYLHYYVVEKFRKRSTETSPTIIGRHIKQGRNAVRRLRRSLHSRRDYQHVIELAYGRKGPFKHLLREAEIEASQPPKLARPPRFMLEPLPGASGETFTLASLEKFLDPSTREATGAAAAEREATEASARLQLAVLRELVPTRWVRRAKFAAPREEDASEEVVVPSGNRQTTKRDAIDERGSGIGSRHRGTSTGRRLTRCAGRRGAPARRPDRRRGTGRARRRRRGW